MASGGLEMVGFLLGLLGMLGTLVATVLPYWRVSAHVGSNIVTAVDNMKGLWMECVYQSTGAFQCETYTSVLALPSDLQASRALMVVSLVMSWLGVALATLGMQCTVCLSAAPVAKSRMAGGGGGLFVTAGFLGLIPVAWTTHEVVQSFYQPGPSSMKFELGDCLYAGLASALLSMMGGTLLCVSCCGDQRQRGGRGGGAGGYPYPGGGGGGGGGGGYPGGGGGVRSSSQTYRNPTLQVGGGPISVPAHPRVVGGGVGRLHSTSSASHSGTHGGAGERKKAVVGYDVTGYV